MSVYKVRIHATVTETYRVIAENEREAASKAELMFRNDNAPEIVAQSFQVRSDSSSHQSPVTSHQSPAIRLVEE